MGTKAFPLNSQAKYRSGGHFKQKADILSLANQEIMVTIRGVTLRPCSRTSSPTIRTLRSLETLQWQIRNGKFGKTLPSAGGSASLTSPSGAPLPVVGFQVASAGCGVSWFNWWFSFAPEFQCCYFCESSYLFYLSFNFDFCVSKIMHL